MNETMQAQYITPSHVSSGNGIDCATEKRSKNNCHLYETTKGVEKSESGQVQGLNALITNPRN